MRMNQKQKNGTAILICGKICSGKSTYVNQLRRERHAAVLSCDDLTLALFDENLGSRHEEITQKAQDYLFQRAAELLALGVNVILEWGFWTRESRGAAEEFFRNRGFETEWHYIEVSDAVWKQRIEKRNAAKEGSYFVDEGVAKKCMALFQPPERKEIDIWVTRC